MAEPKSRRRSKTLVHPRQIAMYLCRELTDASYPEIGRQFGGKDHTTIIRLPPGDESQGDRYRIADDDRIIKRRRSFAVSDVDGEHSMKVRIRAR
ncbi:MAG: hypothetical protein IPK92_15330 [Nitrospira sp.]|nr:hypothetical protein [Nitrospira sp.]